MNLNFLESKFAPLSMDDHHQRSEDFYPKQQQQQPQPQTPPADYELSSGLVRPRNDGLIDDIPAPWEHRPSQSRKTVPLSNMGTPDLVTLYPPEMKTEDQKNCGSSSTPAQSLPPFKRFSSPSYPFPPLPSSVSQSIPIASDSMRRTSSELQLMEDEAMADYRDFCMYSRIVNGISERQSRTELPSPNDNDTINHIIRTRHQPVVLEPSSYYDARGTTSLLHQRRVVTDPQQPKAIMQHRNNFPAAPTLERRIRNTLLREQQPEVVLGTNHLDATLVDDEDCLFEMDDL
jgi:hypothetical protein